MCAPLIRDAIAALPLGPRAVRENLLVLAHWARPIVILTGFGLVVTFTLVRHATGA